MIVGMVVEGMLVGWVGSEDGWLVGTLEGLVLGWLVGAVGRLEG